MRERRERERENESVCESGKTKSVTQKISLSLSFSLSFSWFRVEALSLAQQLLIHHLSLVSKISSREYLLYLSTKNKVIILLLLLF